MLRVGIFWRSSVIVLLLMFNAATAVGLEPELGNSIGMQFVLIPAGHFLMGSPKDEPYRDKGEIQHEVTISKPFYLQTTEVTIKQWQKVMGKPWYYFFRQPRGDGNYPVTRVCQYDVKEFLDRLNKLGEGTYRLPTEAEWEYASRAGSTMAYSWGDRIECSRAMFANNQHGANDCVAAARGRGLKADSPAPVKSYPPNAWGLYDMHGNVWEWCQDWFGPYSSAPRKDPQGPDRGEMRVRRGGSWFSEKYSLRSANRAYGHPASRLNNTGFRVVRLAEES
jgi:formylglycine-generating enzyme required for sulfatase activity